MNAVSEEDDTVRTARSRCLGMLCAYFDPAQVSGVLIDLLGSGAAGVHSIRFIVFLSYLLLDNKCFLLLFHILFRVLYDYWFHIGF